MENDHLNKANSILVDITEARKINDCYSLLGQFLQEIGSWEIPSGQEDEARLKMAKLLQPLTDLLAKHTPSHIASPLSNHLSVISHEVSNYFYFCNRKTI